MNAKTAITATVKLEEFLSFAACIVRSQGYVKGANAREQGIRSTGDLAWEWTYKGRPVELRALTILQEDRVLAKNTAKWMKEIFAGPLMSGNDYMVKLAGIGQAGILSEREAGYAASAIQAYERSQEPIKGSVGGSFKESVKGFVGKIGEKIIFQGIYGGSSTFDSKFGICHKHVFINAEGIKVAWLTSKNWEELGLRQNEAFQVSGTVKKHNSYRGNQETEISRAKIG
jgi:hypothetical protein